MEKIDELEIFLERVNAPFTGGYLYAFVTEFFSNYTDSKKDILKRSKNIYDGIFPGEGASLVKVRLEERLLAEQMGDHDYKLEVDLRKMEFDLGVSSASMDAHEFIQNPKKQPTSLTDFLLNGIQSSD